MTFTWTVRCKSCGRSFEGERNLSQTVKKHSLATGKVKHRNSKCWYSFVLCRQCFDAEFSAQEDESMIKNVEE